MNNVEMARPAQKQAPTQWEQPIHCFYHCSFTTTQSQLMEKHYRQEHYLKPQEVKRG